MILDLFSPANYLMINKDAIKLLGLNTAVYCSELSSIYTKVLNKKKFVNDEKYFNVDRAYIEKQTSLTVEEQIKCDLNLSKVNVIKIDENDPNVIYFDVEIFASLLASENIKLLDSVAEKVKVDNPKGVKAKKEQMIIQNLKKSIECRTEPVLMKLWDWIDTIYASGKGLSKAQVTMFKDKLDDYCNGDLNKAIKVIDAAIVHAYTDCTWAINVYEKQNVTQRPVINNTTRTSMVRVTEQKKTTEISEESF